jgi:hypothetical protein
MMKAGNLGDLTVYIKSREMIEWESGDGEEQKAPDADEAEN